MSEVTIKISANGPLLISSPVELVDIKSGKKVKVDKFPCAICRCGRSGNQPFCDGSHNGCFEGPIDDANLE